MQATTEEPMQARELIGTSSSARAATSRKRKSDPLAAAVAAFSQAPSSPEAMVELTSYSTNAIGAGVVPASTLIRLMSTIVHTNIDWRGGPAFVDFRRHVQQIAEATNRALRPDKMYCDPRPRHRALVDAQNIRRLFARQLKRRNCAAAAAVFN